MYIHQCNRENGSVGQAWFEATLESIADAVIATDKSGAIAAMNAAAERLTGWARHEVCSRSIEDVMVIHRRSTGDRLESPVLRVLRGETINGEDALPDDAMLVRRDGASVSVADSVAAIREPSGAISGAVMVFRDVTAKVRELERLSFLSQVFVEMNASLDFEVTLSTFAKIAVPTIADGCAVVVMKDDEVTSLASAHVDPAKAERVRTHFDKCRLHMFVPIIERGEPELVPEITDAFLARFGAECREVMRALGAISYIGVPLKRDETNVGAIMLVSSARRFDTSDLNVAIALAERAAIAVEHARLFEELRAARADADARRIEAELANRAKDDFLAVLGHELRNPLAPMTTALDLMRLRSCDSLERVVLERQVNHLTRLVDDLLDISRVTSAKLVLAKKRLDLAEVVANGLDLAAPLLQRNEHQLDVSVAAGLWIEGDAVRLAQVVSNLVGNAAKYSDAGAPIQIHAERDNGEIVMTIRDHGIGIDAEILPRIFEAFVQQPQGLDRAGGGLGLGLAIVRGIVNAHGGTVVAHSDGPGRGTELEVRLPAAERLPADEVLDSFSRLPAPVPNERVLVVDDNEDALVLLVELLRRLDFDVVHAKDPRRALELARRTMPSIAFLDIGLPGMNGYELARRLRDLDESGRLNLVAVTGYGLASDRARSLAAGFDVHLVKPVTLEVLESTLERLMDDAESVSAS